ncbi:hypothetical protein [Streptomyces sp. 4N124]|uniref:hypothetical protein n=1 Tax=Streptomyces sp. 4N124 TaxID=3457420 RepID=UPI003FD19E1B
MGDVTIGIVELTGKRWQLGQLVRHADEGAAVDPAAVSDTTWGRLLRDSARRSDYGGRMLLGTDLMHVPVRRGTLRE